MPSSSASSAPSVQFLGTDNGPSGAETRSSSGARGPKPRSYTLLPLQVGPPVPEEGKSGWVRVPGLPVAESLPARPSVVLPAREEAQQAHPANLKGMK